jgi:hypothetical protein
MESILTKTYQKYLVVVALSVAASYFSAVDTVKSEPEFNSTTSAPSKTMRNIASEVGQTLWPKGTKGCSNGTTNISFQDGLVKFHGPFSTIFQEFTDKVDIEGLPNGLLVGLGQPSCRIEIRITAVKH